MEKGYQIEKAGQIYSAVMTLDTRLPIDIEKTYAFKSCQCQCKSCQSCQCKCHLCRGHRAPVLEEMSLKLTEKIFKNLVSV